MQTDDTVVNPIGLDAEIVNDNIDLVEQEEIIERNTLIIKTKSVTGKLTKDIQIDHIDYSRATIRSIKKALNRFHSHHPTVKYIEIRTTQDETSQPLADDLHLDSIGDFEYLYATFLSPFYWATKAQNFYTRYLKSFVDFMKNYFINYTTLGLIFFWWLLCDNMFKKIFFGVLFTLHYLFLKEIIPIKFTFNRQQDNKLKPLITFFLSLYPIWDIYNPQHNLIVDETEEKLQENQPIAQNEEEEDDNGVEVQQVQTGNEEEEISVDENSLNNEEEEDHQ